MYNIYIYIKILAFVKLTIIVSIIVLTIKQIICIIYYVIEVQVWVMHAEVILTYNVISSCQVGITKFPP